MSGFADIGRWRSRALLAGAAGAALSIVGALVSPGQFFQSYLWAYLFVLSVPVGCLAWLMLQYLTGGDWGEVVRRPCEAATRTLPLVALLFVPVVLGIPYLYQWSHADVVARDELLRHKQVYLNVPFFLARAAVYLGGWTLLGWLVRTRPRWSAPGLIFWAFSVTFMAVDWVLSIDPHWFSTIFGMLFMAGQGLASMAFLVALLVALSGTLTARHLHDLGKFLLALVMVWAYFSFSQFLIIWAGNLPDEIPWYLERLRGGWQYVGLLLVLGHFALPFALLLSRDLKRNFRLLRAVALFILAMRMVDVFWLVAPGFRKGHLSLSWLDAAAPLAIGGLWLWAFLGQLEEAPAHGRE